MVTTLGRIPAAWLDLSTLVGAQDRRFLQVVAVQVYGVAVQGHREGWSARSALPGRRDFDLTGLAHLGRGAGLGWHYRSSARSTGASGSEAEEAQSHERDPEPRGQVH